MPFSSIHVKVGDEEVEISAYLDIIKKVKKFSSETPECEPTHKEKMEILRKINQKPDQ